MGRPTHNNKRPGHFETIVLQLDAEVYQYAADDGGAGECDCTDDVKWKAWVDLWPGPHAGG